METLLKGIGLSDFCTLALFTILLSTGYSQDSVKHPVRLMFYNVENLFDVVNDTAKDDEAFLPHGVMRWNEWRYQKKINALYKTIIAAGEWSPPELIAFSEIENRKVLNDLIYGTYLSKFNYGIIHEESPDIRGIDVCLIYRKDFMHILKYDYWIPAGFKKGEYRSRSILHASIATSSDTIDLIVNHWPSRRGGELAGAGMRQLIALMIREKIDSINSATKRRKKFIITGDFNCTPDDKEMKILINSEGSENPLVNLSSGPALDGLGTYRYMGTWEMIDQVIVSENLLSTTSGLYTDFDMITIFKPDFLLTKDPKYPGLSPTGTYKGYLYQGGVSDHLPVLLNLSLRHQSQRE